ncbi:hypothetical protein [Clostridium sp. UBA4548]|nr:hypothetical protein [Clostridium sp. UBA4548]
MINNNNDGFATREGIIRGLSVYESIGYKFYQQTEYAIGMYL